MQRLINPGDMKLYVVAALCFAVIALIAAGTMRLCGTSLHKLLTAAEWKVVGKMFVLLILFFILFLRLINADLPPQIFLYGRF